MKRILLLCLTAVFTLASVELWAQERTISGRVTSTEDGSPLPGVNVVLKGTTNGSVTDAEGNYRLTVPSEGGTLVFTFIGLRSQEVEIGGRTTIDLNMEQDVTQLSEVVVTALNVSRETKTLPYAVQEVKAKQLNITNDANLKTALAGKVAGVQVAGQAGSKLGEFGKIRIRGRVSLNQDADPLYVVDGVPMSDPNDIDMDNVESLNVLKGPNATALYGQRGDAGVIEITTKKGSSNNISVELLNSTTWDKVAYLPKYQNKYGLGYEGEDSFATFDFNGGVGPYGAFPAEWSVFDGARYIQWDNNYADESWGPKFDNAPYVPWYAWWPGSAEKPNPYFGKTVPYSAQPDNVKDFFETGVSMKNTVSISGGTNAFRGRFSYSKLDQSGIIPSTDLNKHFFLTNFDFNASQRLNLAASVKYTMSKVIGDYDDGYANQTSGSFNQWFNRNLEMDKLRELKDLTTPKGYSASWNWWGPDYYTLGGGYDKPAFWFNPYTYMEKFKQIQNRDNLTASLRANFKINDKFNVTGQVSRNQNVYKREFYFPFFLANSAAPNLYNAWINSFGLYDRQQSENNYLGQLNYKQSFSNGDFDVAAMVGGNVRHDHYDRFSAEMNVGAKEGGLIIPDDYRFSNAGEVPTPTSFVWDKEVRSLFGNVSLGYKGMAYLDASYRQDWSSALPENNNGYGYYSLGASFVFSEVLDSDVLSFGKFRAGIAQVGSDVDALTISQTYPIAAKPFSSSIVMYTPTTLVDPNLTPAINNSFETGLDLKFLENRIGLSLTWFTETRTNEIVSVGISRATGYSNFLTNVGESNRKGIEAVLTADVLKMANGFTWTTNFNIAKYQNEVIALAEGTDAMPGPGGSDDWGFVTVYQQLGGTWGQLRGRGFARDENGNKIVQDNGLYETTPDQYFGSILPDFQGGWLNTFSFKGLSLQVAMDFQKGGKFFSLSEMWGEYSGLMAATAATNDRGGNVRDDETETGGVHVIGVLADGTPFDEYVNGYEYYQQFQTNTIAEEYIHEASYIKLRDVSLSYDFGKMLSSQRYIKGLTIGIVGRNLARFGMSKDNKNSWDPSEISGTGFESGQLPGTRSYGVNVRLTF
jgi:TonB-linked SusC/RagA family outer membrane protein